MVLHFHMSHDYPYVYDVRGHAIRRTGGMKIEIGCELIDEGRRMSIDDFIDEVQNLPDEKAPSLNLVLQYCSPEILDVQIPHNNKTISVGNLLTIMLEIINEKMERVAYEKELNGFLNERG